MPGPFVNAQITAGHSWGRALLIALVIAMTTGSATATLTEFTDVSGANDAIITISPPNPVQPNPNDGILLAWDERQNVTLEDALAVDRVFDDTAPFVSPDGSGGYLLQAGTVVSSHYLQWDPGNGSSSRVQATIGLDSQVFAFITADQKLFDSDAALGLPGLDYNDFNLRGLETQDTTEFNGPDVDIDWTASSPGDWTRLLTAFSPTAAPELMTNNASESAATVDFGLVRIGTADTADLTLTNAGGDEPEGLAGTVPSPAGGEFALDDAEAFGPIAPDDSETRQYRYAPTDRGDDTLALGAIDSNDPDGTGDADAFVTLTGTGVGPEAGFAFEGDAVSSGGMLTFGTVGRDDTLSLTLNAANITTDDNGGLDALTDLTILEVELGGDDADEFSLVDFTPGSVIGKAGELDLDILFDPNGALGVFDDATLTLLTDEGAALGAEGTSFTFNLSGTSIPEPATAALLAMGFGLVGRGGRRAGGRT